MLHAARLKDRSATIEHARLLWKDGHHRKAIQTLEGAIFASEGSTAASSADSEEPSLRSGRGQRQNVLAARVSSIAHFDFRVKPPYLRTHRRISCWQSGRTEQAKRILTPLSNGTGKPSSCTQSQLTEYRLNR